MRVKAPLLDRLVNQAGEVSITRSRLESDVTQMRSSLRELTENLDRLRRQLRDIELQADTQIASRLEASKSSSAEFDPLEMDRFTRFQELTRMMAESVNDVATVQRSITQTVQSAEDEMAAQARLTRALSGRPAARAHGAVRRAVRTPVSRRAPGRQGNLACRCA